ncbi:V-type ATP synthase subunit D [Rhodococcus sp. ABRD24]|uniref:V-type ATP synthase subunit D n=1 Tax=Rhodococcus sp. ABRD24 TaxID=2507582 RepID=UPI0013F17E35|nr:V-type ATP synthase subunit D [Rhodococcus sp. ABRD24]
MTRLGRVPPGRAGRVWLQRRLAVARSGAELLDRKQRILHTARQRFAQRAEETGAEWERAAHDAETWLVRAAMLDGQRALRPASGQSADIQIAWSHSMGITYPAEAICVVPPPAPDAASVGGSASIEARLRHTAALEIAVRHAAASAALRAVDSEERATRKRLRAITDRWIPALQEALAHSALALEEQERADGLRRRWAARRAPRRTNG